MDEKLPWILGAVGSAIAWLWGRKSRELSLYQQAVELLEECRTREERCQERCDRLERRVHDLEARR